MLNYTNHNKLPRLQNFAHPSARSAEAPASPVKRGESARQTGREDNTWGCGSKKLSVIIVNFQSEKYLEKCIVSLYDKFPPNLDFEVVVVNNDRLEKLETIREKFREVFIIGRNENTGFGAGQNFGSARAKGEYLLFLNPDTEILSENIDRVIRTFREDEKIGAIGSRLVSSSGRFQDWSYGKETDIRELFRNNFKFFPKTLSGERQEKTIVDWVSGTALFIRRKTFDDIGGFDERFFMYFEDMDLCQRIRKKGQKIIYHPHFSVLHHGGKSYSSRYNQKKDYYDSQEYYFEKHHGKWQARTIKLFRKIFFRYV